MNTDPLQKPQDLPVDGFKKHTLHPTSTGTSVIGVKFDTGVVLAADMLASYGSLARYTEIERMIKVNDKVVVVAGGDMADFQFLSKVIKLNSLSDNIIGDGFHHSAAGIHSWITRVLYNRRSRFDPLWNVYVSGGMNADGSPHLGYSNMLGVSYPESCVATGFGGHLALPLLRRGIEENGGSSDKLSEAKAIEIVTSAMRTLYYRDCRAFNTYQLAVVTADGVRIQSHLKLETNWDLADYVEGYE